MDCGDIRLAQEIKLRRAHEKITCGDVVDDHPHPTFERCGTGRIDITTQDLEMFKEVMGESAIGHDL
jgi:hypothetical protein